MSKFKAEEAMRQVKPKTRAEIANEKITKESIENFLSDCEICCASASSMNAGKLLIYVVKEGVYKVQYNDTSKDFEHLDEAVDYYNNTILV